MAYCVLSCFINWYKLVSCCFEESYDVDRPLVCSSASAVIYECMQTITSIYPHPALVDLAARCVGRFLSSHNINLHYIGQFTLRLLLCNAKEN